MSLDAARKRHGKSKRRAVSIPTASHAADINVTPLVDVVLVLLIIFMVMTPAAQKMLSIKLTSQTSTSVAPPRAEPEQLIVTLRAQGARINETSVSHDQLEAQLRSRLSQRADGERVVFVVAEQDVSYGALVESVASAKRAGASTVGVVP
jgi:biopolymer transport protein ExbD